MCAVLRTLQAVHICIHNRQFFLQSIFQEIHIGIEISANDFLDGKSELVSPLEDAISDLCVLEEIKAKY